ncbi:unnamed protein product [Ectocarpus sp. 6 AP-2014]
MTRQHPQEYSPCGRVTGGSRRRPATDHSSKKSRLTLRSISLHELGWTADSPCVIRSQRSVDGEASSTSRLHVRGLGVRKLKPTSPGGHRRYSSLRRWRTQPSLSAARNISAAIAALVITILPAQGADLSTEYLKPSLSSKASFFGKRGRAWKWQGLSPQRRRLLGTTALACNAIRQTKCALPDAKRSWTTCTPTVTV